MTEYTVAVVELTADYSCSDDQHPVTVNGRIQGYIINIICWLEEGCRDFTFLKIFPTEKEANAQAAAFLACELTIADLKDSPIFLDGDRYHDEYIKFFEDIGIEPWSECWTNSNGIGSYTV